MTKTVWGTVSGNGDLLAGAGCTISKQGTGIYVIDFTTSFSGVPALVGSQTGFGSQGQSPLDNVAFPFLTGGTATAVTGDNQGSKEDRQFSFIAIGN
ncbi:hypothetical protein C8N35_102460 [Breoghania corrubedonensis]|uniref:Uncharacterized protein n=1 Tax=Breoghania corrubedonensis TaxID=665038 RepID=A0A2T5VDD4_9HYPH|nr:hypothetical protein [Breoghania corrubedonensis]PTW61744.1 hypothetical protein C8N35_102460 [Breoghania corrubedonensis]